MVQTMKCKDSNERKDNMEHLTLNEILKMFDEKLEKFFKQTFSKFHLKLNVPCYLFFHLNLYIS
jgi:hypothetical protein